MWKFAFIATLIASATFCGAQSHNASELDYDPMVFTVLGSSIVANGTIDGETFARFVQVSRENPALKTLILEYVEGSVDDEANLKFSQFVRDSGFTTVVPANGFVASGGTDLFLAGVHRILEAGACVGVHSWSDGINEGIDYPRSDPEHRKYLKYYRQMGIEEDLYWFTLEAAAANDMYWMTASEAEQYGMSTQQMYSLGRQNDCNDR